MEVNILTKPLTDSKSRTEGQYSQEEALRAATDYFEGDELAASVWLNKYALKDSDGNTYESHTAWESGCKGCAIYRDGSRTGVLVSKERKGKNPELSGTVFELRDSVPPKRLKKLVASVLHFKNNHEDWIAVIGTLQNKPYEIFSGKAEDTFRLPDYVTQGWIIKKF
ncbi:MAG: hypothetical protein OEQ53_12645 [Saprospiraceae bacterium]|nr:hypothetical protein [Saprospiraceae bacterium]